MERFVSPDAPLTFVFPETRNPSVMGEPRANYGRVCPGSRQGLFVNVSGFHRAEHDQRDRDDKSDERYQHAQAAKRHEPVPVSLPPVRSWR